MGYCKRHDSYNGNGQCKYCFEEFIALPAKWHPPHGGSVRGGYWECLRDSVKKQRECKFYNAGTNGWCVNLHGDECVITRI